MSEGGWKHFKDWKLDVADYLETAATECNKKKVDVFIEVDQRVIFR
jgi:hypothetical protein